VDGLHFVMSIGLEEVERYGEVYPIYGIFHSVEPIKYESITEQFNYLFYQVGYFMDCVCLREFGTNSEIDEQFEQTFRMFLGLGKMLGFTWEQIEEAYLAKNAVNHQRQANGY
jgi:dimeric dUTPase (all-alpha-NTP-PPase superfamily)